MKNAPETIDFGFETIPLEQKQGRVNHVFDEVASKYDLMNDVLSLRLHRVWKQSLITKMHIPRGNLPFAHLDVAGGTGDIVARALQSAGTRYSATLLDINEAMLREAAVRFSSRSPLAGELSSVSETEGGILTSKKENPSPYPLPQGEGSKCVNIILGNAEALPFADATFDCVTIAFGLRNVPRRTTALAEFHRVLKPGGQFLCLEFSPVEMPGVKQVYDAYSLHVMPKLGQWIANDADSYRYLAESIRKFPSAQRLELEMQQAGFKRTKFTRFSAGIVALHQGWKL